MCVCGVAEYPATTISYAGGWSRPGGSPANEDAPRCPGPNVPAGLRLGHCHGSWRAHPKQRSPFLPFSPKPAEPQLYSRLTSCTRTMRDLSVVLETHQLYSRLISCTRKISTLHLEFKCVCACVVPVLAFGSRASWL